MGIRNKDHITQHDWFDFKGVMLPCYFVSMILFIPGCIEPFFPDNIENPRILSIEGSLIKGDSIQKVIVSKTAAESLPIYYNMVGNNILTNNDNYYLI